MHIPFRHVGKIAQPFEVGREDVILKGTLVHKEGAFFQMKAVMEGRLSVGCDICAEQFDIMLDDKIDLLLFDGIYRGSDNGLDIVEMDEKIDMDELLHSEIELIRSDYHWCEQCTEKESVEITEQ